MSFENPISFQDLLNFRLARLHASSGALVTRLCEGEYGITRREWRLIAMLACYGAISPSELAAFACTDRGLVSRAIADLESKELVVRVRSPSDKRRASVDLTPQGHKLYQEFFPRTAAINGQVLNALSPEQIRAFDEALTVLTRTAERLNQTSPITAKADRRRGGNRPQGDATTTVHRLR